jgi:long-chain acyl-CoA synthetase
LFYDIARSEYETIGDLMRIAANRYENLPAYRQFGQDMSFRRVEEASASLSAYLMRDLSLEKGDRIALMLPNIVQYPVAMFAATRAGLVVVNVNPLYTAHELAAMIVDSKPKVIVVLDAFAETLQKAVTMTPGVVEQVVVANVADFMTFPRSIMVNTAAWWKSGRRNPHRLEGTVEFRHAMTARRPDEFSPPELSSEDVAFIQYTGGTTGGLKGAVLTHGNVLANAVATAGYMADTTRPGRETTIIAMPLYHVVGLVAQCLTAIHYGSKAVLVANARDIPSLVADFTKHRPTMFTGLNTLFAALLENKDFRSIDFSNLRSTTAGGMATNPEVAEDWKRVTGCTVHEGYGLSEVSGAISATPASQERFDGSVGIPFRSVKIEIRDDAGTKLRPGERGEIFIAGPMVMRGYYGQPEETARVLGQDGFLATGDIGTMDDKGFVTILDRKKDMILVSGFNVYPTEIEKVIIQHDGVADVAVVGVPHERCGEAPVACVIRSREELSETDLTAFARERLTAYKRPVRFVFVDKIQKTPVGKVLRRDLRAMLTNA